jgi:putative ABC transport system substrate-binding protein
LERIRRAGYFIAVILKGVNPGDIPVERTIFVELVVNMKAAKALGLTAPTSIVIRATDLPERHAPAPWVKKRLSCCDS